MSDIYDALVPLAVVSKLLGIGNFRIYPSGKCSISLLDFLLILANGSLCIVAMVLNVNNHAGEFFSDSQVRRLSIKSQVVMFALLMLTIIVLNTFQRTSFQLLLGKLDEVNRKCESFAVFKNYAEHKLVLVLYLAMCFVIDFVMSAVSRHAYNPKMFNTETTIVALIITYCKYGIKVHIGQFIFCLLLVRIHFQSVNNIFR
jgi:hypothetical protein